MFFQLEGFHSSEYDGNMIMNVESSVLAFTLFEEHHKTSLRTTGNVTETQTVYFQIPVSSIPLSAGGTNKPHTHC